MPIVCRFQEIGKFSARVMPFLERDEANNSLPIRILYGLNRSASPIPADTYLAVCQNRVGESEPIMGVALRTPPHNLVLSHPFPVAALVPIVEDCRAQALPGVVGPGAEADAFAAAWCAVTGGNWSLVMGLGAQALEGVIPAPPTPGHLRPAEPKDSELAAEWTVAIHAEAMRGTPPPRLPVDIEGWFFWEVDGCPVTSVRAVPSTPNSATINAVYTPPPLRRRGYATAAVAAVSSLMLARGRRYCYLFTDLANPTSNGIYRRIGFRYVGEFRQIGFQPPSGGLSA